MTVLRIPVIFWLLLCCSPWVMAADIETIGPGSMTDFPDTGADMPDVSMPDVSMPDVSMPDVSMPDTAMPAIPDTSSPASVGSMEMPADFSAPAGVGMPNDGGMISLPDTITPSTADLMNQKSFLWGGYIRNETAYRFDEPRSFTKIRNILSLNAQYEFGKRAKLYGSGWYYYDMVYNLFNYETIAARTRREIDQPLPFVEQLRQEKDSNLIDVREFYLDYYHPMMDVRLGRQFIIWGVLEGIRVVDEINPMDFRELILLDLLDYRVPLWSAKANVYWGDNNIEAIVIPDLRFHEPAPAGSEWELFQVLPATSKPDRRNPFFWEYGLKLTREIGGAEMSFSYFYTWDDYPTTFRVINIRTLETSDPTQNLPIFPTYMRMHMFGSTIVKEVKGNILKGELVYVRGKYFAIVDKDDNNDGFLDADGEIPLDHIRWGLGYDFSKWGADFSPAIAQWVIMGYNEDVLSHQFDTTINLFIRKPLSKHQSIFTLLMIHLINFQETYIKPKFTFHLSDRLTMESGLDLFIGPKTQFGRAIDPSDFSGLTDIEQRAQFLGNFQNNRRVFVNFKYTF